MAEIIRSAFNKENLIKNASTICIPGNPIMLGEYVVPAGEMVKIGYGQLDGQENAQGRIFIDMRNTADGLLDGFVRITAYSAQNRALEILQEYRTETLRQNETDRTKQIPFSEHQAWVPEDKKIVLEFIADSAVTVDKVKTKVLMDITKQVF